MSTYASKADALKVIKQQLESNGKGCYRIGTEADCRCTNHRTKKKELLTAYVEGLGNCRLTPVANRIPFASGFRSDPFGIRN